MYDLPKNFDGTSLHGRVLEMICFNANQISLHFEGHASLVVEDSLRYVRGDGSVQVLSPPVSSTDVMQLIGSRLASVVAVSSHQLVFSFSNGQQIECVGSSKEYEAYHLSFDDVHIIV